MLLQPFPIPSLSMSLVLLLFIPWSVAAVGYFKGHSTIVSAMFPIIVCFLDMLSTFVAYGFIASSWCYSNQHDYCNKIFQSNFSKLGIDCLFLCHLQAISSNCWKNLKSFWLKYTMILQHQYKIHRCSSKEFGLRRACKSCKFWCSDFSCFMPLWAYSDYHIKSPFWRWVAKESISSHCVVILSPTS